MIGFALDFAAEGNTFTGGTPPPPDPDPGGGPSPGRTDLPLYTLVFDENFDRPCAEGTFLQAANYGNRFFTYADGSPDTYGKANPGTSMYNSRILSVGPSSDPSVGNVMKIRQRIGTDDPRTQYNNRPWGSPPIPKFPGRTGWPWNGQRYGRYEARFRLATAVPGYKMAWELWPDSENWPPDGEIDYPEVTYINSSGQWGTIIGWMHRQDASSGSDQDPIRSNAQVNTWHTMALEWRPNFCRPILDGVALTTITSRVPNTSMHWIMQCETNLPGGTRPSGTGVCTLEVDYVSCWAYTP